MQGHGRVAPVLFGSVTLRAANGSSGSTSWFGRFLCRWASSVVLYSFSRKTWLRIVPVVLDLVLRPQRPWRGPENGKFPKVVKIGRKSVLG